MSLRKNELEQKVIQKTITLFKYGYGPANLGVKTLYSW
jgi:hypothetical protein